MSILLQYEFGVAGLAKVKSAFKTVEGYAAESAKNEARTHERMARPARARVAKATIDPQKKAIDDLQKYGATRMRQQLQEQTRNETKAHQGRMRQIDVERREGMAAEKARDRVRRATIGTVAKSAFSSVAGVGKAVLGATGIAGGAIVASRIGPGIDLEHKQREVLRAGRLAGTDQAMTAKEFSGKVSAASIATGASQMDITAGVGAFVQKTGDIKQATDNIQNFATVAMATGATVEDIGSAAADLSQKFDIKTTEGMADALAMLAFQGKKGAFEIKNMAAEFPVLASAAANAGMTGTGGVKQLGGLIQIATVGAGKEQATTALVDAFAELSKHAHDLETGKDIPGHKISVYEKGKGIGHGEKQRNFGDVVTELIGGAHGDMTKIEPIFGLRGVKAISPLVSAYQHADMAAGGGKTGDIAGRAAIAAMIKENVEAGGTFKEVQIDAASAMKDTSAQLEILNTKIQDAVDSKLLTALTDLIPKIEPLIPKFGELLDSLASWIGWLAEHPASGIGIAIVGAIVKDIAAARLAPAVEEAVMAAIAAARGASAAGGAAAGLAGLAGNAAASGGAMATARGALGAAVGASPLMMTAGSIAIAAGAVYMANDQNDKLKGETGGLGILDLVAGAFSGKGGFFTQANDQLNAQAKAAAAQEEAANATKVAAEAMQKAAGAMQPGAPTGPVGAPNRGPDPTAPRG